MGWRENTSNERMNKCALKKGPQMKIEPIAIMKNPGPLGPGKPLYKPLLDHHLNKTY